jgi:translation initiation factor IF-1
MLYSGEAQVEVYLLEKSPAPPIHPFARQMSKEDSIEVTGTVVEKFPAGQFSVQLDQERIVLAHLAGKLRRNRIRVLAGDRVTLELSPYDLTKGRITYRHK